MPFCCRRFLPGILLLSMAVTRAVAALSSGEVHVWDAQEIILQSDRHYPNPYAEVDCWIELKGPAFDRKIRGFWDGGQTFRVRFVCPSPGEWTWHSGSNQPDDHGLNEGHGKLRAVGWTEAEKIENANRHGFVHATANGHALQYADGTPFFIVGDTWLAASTWRLPLRGLRPADNYQPESGISFEEAVAYRKKQGFNSISLISAFPNWAADQYGATYKNKDGIYLRNAWEKFGFWAASAAITTADGATTTAKDMGDEDGNRPFAIFRDREGLADFDRINPVYFQHLDGKMRLLSAEGFVPILGTVRRDHGPSWKKYFDFNRSYARYVEYLVARYGAYNLVFSGIHLDWIPKDYSLTADEFNAALTWHLKTYGPPPFGQPFTTLIDHSTYQAFGHGDRCPWLTMHSVGNKPRDHRIYAALEKIFRLDSPDPVANMEPYYTGWNHEINRPGGETPAPDSDRNNYFARAMMYGSVLSGGLAGHVYGTGAYDVTTTGEPEGWRPAIWTALRYAAGGQMQFLRSFILSEGARYQDLLLASEDLQPRRSPGAPADGLDGWSYMMRTADRTFALLYFENKAAVARLAGFTPNARYRWTWFNPRRGAWSEATSLNSNADGTIDAPAVPKEASPGIRDWAARLDLAR